jgi:hypothetical protein
MKLLGAEVKNTEGMMSEKDKKLLEEDDDLKQLMKDEED